MSWSIGYDSNWKRDIGYSVPAYCDFPGCGKEIDRGLSRVCGGEPYGGERGCGLYFCTDHLLMANARVGGETRWIQLCSRCAPRIKKPFKPTPDHPEWIHHKLTDESWQKWRDENPEEVQRLTLTEPVSTS